MSISNTAVSQTYACNGVNTNFAITFDWFDTTQIQVYLIDVATQVETLLVLSTNYTFSPNAINPTAIITNTAYPSTKNIRVERVTPRTQIINYINNSAFLAEDHERGLDRLVMMMQELGVKADSVGDIALAVEQAQAAAALATSVVLAVTLDVQGTKASPVAVTVGGITPTVGRERQKKYVQGSGGPIAITTIGTTGVVDGTTLRLIGCSDTNTLTLTSESGNLRLNGDCILGLNNIIDLDLDLATGIWVEAGRSH